MTIKSRAPAVEKSPSEDLFAVTQETPIEPLNALEDEALAYRSAATRLADDIARLIDLGIFEHPAKTSVERNPSFAGSRNA
ncbi:hypothetical protein [Breoghania sp. L-A4]|uniref:hypothetical protein n=1 Tax=Breoghania sp. L-A4 TaxID=2304600 RepID=UPI0013C2EF2B|nr:hypothetical protein [Breoghania sp. L-A4]